MALTVERRPLPFRVLRNLQKQIDGVFATTLSTALQQMEGVVGQAQPHMDEEILRGVLVKSAPVGVTKSTAECVRLAQQVAKKDFVVLSLGLMTDEEIEVDKTAEYTDQRRARVWIASYQLFRAQGMKDAAARVVVERDPEYLRIKSVADAAARIRVNVRERCDKCRAVFVESGVFGSAEELGVIWDRANGISLEPLEKWSDSAREASLEARRSKKEDAGSGAGRLKASVRPSRFLRDIAEQDSFRREGIEGCASRSGKSVDEYKEEVRVKLQGMLDRSLLSTRVPGEDTLVRILEEGRFKSQFETGESKGSFDLEFRSKMEQRLFSYSESETEDDQRPVYGYLRSPEDLKVERGAVAYYGSVEVVFKDSVKDRATWVAGDSFGCQRAAVYPTSVREADIASVVYYKSGWEDPMEGKSLPNGTTYAEAQVHGGLKTGDIDKVIFRSADPPGYKVKEALKKYGVKWEHSSGR